MNLTKRMACLASALLCSAAQAATIDLNLPAGCPRASHFVLLHTNDHHGSVYGGLARQATLLRTIKQEDLARFKCPVHLLLSAGDVMSGDIASDVLDNEPDFAAMHAAGYQAMTLGNHDLDKGLATLDRLITNAGKFPILAANSTRFDPYLLVRVHDDRNSVVQTMIVIGVTAAKAATASLTEEDRTRITFKPALESVKRVLAELASPPPSPKPELIAVLAHLGGITEMEYQGEPSSLALATALSGQVDVVIDGHKHEAARADRLPLFSAGDSGRFVGHVVFTAGTKGARAKFAEFKLVPVDAGIKEDAAINKLLFRYRNDPRARRYFRVVFGKNPVFFEGDRAAVSKAPTNLSRFLNDAYAWCGGAELSILAPSAVRTSVHPGKVTEGDIANVSPFMNEGGSITVAVLSGKDLKTLMTQRKGELYFSDSLKGLEPLEDARVYSAAGVRWLFDSFLGKKFPFQKALKKPSKKPSGTEVSGAPYYVADCVVDYARTFSSLAGMKRLREKYGRAD